MAVIRQPSFVGGELAPELWGRTDLERRSTGARTLLNFFVSHQGAAVSRPGLRFVNEVKDSTRAVRIIPFIYSDETSYVLEFGHQSIRVWKDGAMVPPSPADYAAWDSLASYVSGDRVSYGVDVYEATGAVPPGEDPTNNAYWVQVHIIDLETTYTEDELARLKFVQSGDVLVIVHPNHAPAELSRVNHQSWTLADIDLVRPTAHNEVAAEGPSWGNKFAVDEATIPTPVAGTHPAKQWTFKITRLIDNGDGTFTESAPFTVSQSALHDGSSWVRSSLGGAWKVALYSDKPVMLYVAEWAGTTAPLITQPYYIHRIYRGRGDVFGWVGDTQITTFTDYAQEPDYSRPPPMGRNPFASSNHPSTVAYFEERRVFAGLLDSPAGLQFSASGDYENFDTHALVPADSDAAEYELAARRREEIRGLVALEKLLVLTNSSVWSFGGGGGEPLSPAGRPDAKVQLEIGSSWVDPLVVGNTVLMARAKGTGVRDLFYDFQQQSYTGGDVSRPAQHLFTDYTLVEWAYAEDPWGVAWAVRSDGVLLSLTYEREAGVWAWARHETLGFVESVCVVPEYDLSGVRLEDVLYVVVRRSISGVDKRYIERMASRTFSAESDAARVVALDSSVTAETVLKTSFGAYDVTGLGHLEGKEVWALADGVVMGPFTVTAGKITLTAEPSGKPYYSVVTVGLAYDCDLEPLDLPGSEQKNVTHVGFEVVGSRGFWVGETFDKLTEWRQRAVSDSYSVPSAATALVRMAISSGWNTTGRAALRQKDPLFVTVLGVSREVAVGGR